MRKLSKEAKANLIFLVIIVLMMAPGGVQLFIKKLDPNERPMYLPHAVPHQAHYADAEFDNPNITRVSAPRTENWLQQQAAASLGQFGLGVEAGDAIVRLFSGEISSGRTFELLASRLPGEPADAAPADAGPEPADPAPESADAAPAGPHRFGVVVWRLYTNPPIEGIRRFTLDGQPCRGGATQELELPDELLEELRDVGWVRPPRSVHYFEMSCGPLGASASDSVVASSPGVIDMSEASGSVGEAEPPVERAGRTEPRTLTMEYVQQGETMTDSLTLPIDAIRRDR